MLRGSLLKYKRGIPSYEVDKFLIAKAEHFAYLNESQTTYRRLISQEIDKIVIEKEVDLPIWREDNHPFTEVYLLLHRFSFLIKQTREHDFALSEFNKIDKNSLVERHDWFKAYSSICYQIHIFLILISGHFENQEDNDLYLPILINEQGQIKLKKEDFATQLKLAEIYKGLELQFCTDSMDREVAIENLEKVYLEKTVAALEEGILKPKVLDKDHTKMIYVYDFFNMWTFYIELADITKADETQTYPNLLFVHGQLPDSPPDKQFEAEAQPKKKEAWEEMLDFDDELNDGNDFENLDDFDFDENWN